MKKNSLIKSFVALCSLFLIPSVFALDTILDGEGMGAVRSKINSTIGVVNDLQDGGNTHAWWFTPIVEGLAREASITETDLVLTNYEDIITYDLELTPLVYTASYDVVVGDAPETVRYYSADGLFDVNETNGACVSVVQGEGEIILQSASLERRLTLTSQTTLPGDIGYSEQLANHVYLDNTVKKHVNDTFEALIAGNDGSDSNLFLYSTQDHATTNYVRNTNCWAYSLDLTCASPWNSTGDGSLAGKTGLPSGQFRAATAITPRHLLSSNHYHLRQDWGQGNTNWLVRFVDANNNVYERNATAHQVVVGCDWSITNFLASAYQSDTSRSGYNIATNWQPDYVVLRLDEELPASILPAKRMPDDWMDYMPFTQGFTNYYNSQRSHVNFPLVMTDQQERVTIGESYSVGFQGAQTRKEDYGGYHASLFSPPNFLFERRDSYAAFYRPKINGDSSSPVFMFINGDPVLTGTLTLGGGGAAWIGAVYCHDRIQDIITNTFGDTNIWEEVDLTGFQTFERVD